MSVLVQKCVWCERGDTGDAPCGRRPPLRSSASLRSVFTVYLRCVRRCTGAAGSRSARDSRCCEAGYSTEEETGQGTGF